MGHRWSADCVEHKRSVSTAAPGVLAPVYSHSPSKFIPMIQKSIFLSRSSKSYVDFTCFAKCFIYCTVLRTLLVWSPQNCPFAPPRCPWAPPRWIWIYMQKRRSLVWCFMQLKKVWVSADDQKRVTFLLKVSNKHWTQISWDQLRPDWQHVNNNNNNNNMSSILTLNFYF